MFKIFKEISSHPSLERLTIITPLSRSLSVIIFIALPGIAFFLGYQYPQDTVQSVIGINENLDPSTVVSNNATGTDMVSTVEAPIATAQNAHRLINCNPKQMRDWCTSDMSPVDLEREAKALSIYRKYLLKVEDPARPVYETIEQKEAAVDAHLNDSVWLFVSSERYQMIVENMHWKSIFAVVDLEEEKVTDNQLMSGGDFMFADNGFLWITQKHDAINEILVRYIYGTEKFEDLDYSELPHPLTYMKSVGLDAMLGYVGNPGLLSTTSDSVTLGIYVGAENHNYSSFPEDEPIEFRKIGSETFWLK